MVRALLSGPPKTSEADAHTMAMLGITAAQIQQEPEAIELWPEHAEPLRLFVAMLTQWRTGLAGPVGLDYAVLPWVASQIGIGARKLSTLFADLQAMERAALNHLAERHQARS